MNGKRQGSDDIIYANLSNRTGHSHMLDVFILVSDPFSDKMTQRYFQVDAHFAKAMDTPQKSVREMNFLNRVARAMWSAYYEMTAWLDEGKEPNELQILRKLNAARTKDAAKRVDQEEPAEVAGYCIKHPGVPFVLLKAGFSKITGTQRYQKVCKVCRSETQKRYAAKRREAKNKVS